MEKQLSNKEIMYVVAGLIALIVLMPLLKGLSKAAGAVGAVLAFPADFMRKLNHQWDPALHDEYMRIMKGYIAVNTYNPDNPGDKLRMATLKDLKARNMITGDEYEYIVNTWHKNKNWTAAMIAGTGVLRALNKKSWELFYDKHK